MRYDTDLDILVIQSIKIELVDLNIIHMIRIILYVASLYTAEINED